MIVMMKHASTTSRRIILHFTPGPALLIMDHGSSSELAYVTHKVSFFRVYVHICTFGGANNADRDG